MVSKKVCKTCWNKRTIGCLPFTYWDEANEKKWKMGYAFCVEEQDIIKVKDNSMPPKGCPYKVEHLVLTDNDSKQLPKYEKK